MASQRRRNDRQQKLILILAVIVLVVIVAGITFMTTFVKKYSPSREVSDYASHYNLSAEDSVFVTFDNQQMEENGILSDGEAYVHYQTVHDYLNGRFYWDGTEQILRYTIPEGLISVTPDTEQYTLGKDAQTAEHKIVIVRDGNMYLSLSFIQQYTDIHYEVYEDPGRVVISDEWDEVTFTGIKKATQIREKGGVKSPILKEVKKGDLVTVLETMDSWVKVCSQDGFIGYVKAKCLGGEQEVLYDHNYEEPVFSHISKDFRVNMAWHQVTNQSANSNISSVLSTAKGVNVISPTWFYLDDNEGKIASLASADYVSCCHQQGVEVWGLVSNLENEEVDTTAVLGVTSSRDNLVNNLISEAIRCDLDGINVDFESLEAEAGDGFLQFIRELSLKCENNDLVLSVDNYVPSGYTEFYDRAEQAVFADYIVVMAYDEHFRGSEEGSVASLGFVNQGIEDTLQDVPAGQVILGIPFYTRVWELTPSEDAQDGQSYTVDSEAVGMSEVETRVAANGATLEWLEDCGQYYAEYEHDGKTYKIWVEDQNSIEKKLEVMTSNNLAGAAFWKLGYEKNTVWDTIVKFMN